MRIRSARIALVLAATGCNQQPQGVTLRSLEASGRSSFLCVGTPAFGDLEDPASPRNLELCEDQDPYELDGENRHLLAMVTQTTRGEVAVVDLTRGKVVDQEKGTPGYNFLPVGGQPVSIASTPGSVATFVAVGEVGKEGIYALPTSCIATPREEGERVRDLLTWPACRLPSAPGEMVVLVDPARDEDGDPSTPDTVRRECASTERVPANQPTGNAATRAVCPADLSTETQQPGRRKLAVALPDRGEIAILDAQEILDEEPGSFDPCPIERYVRLRVELPTDPIVQEAPPDLALSGCAPFGLSHPGAVSGSDFMARPAGFARDEQDPDHRLFVADRDAPVIHVLRTEDPCAVTEAPPLLPVSFVNAARMVTTKKLAVSPVTSKNQRFVYAIDEIDNGSVMVFDVSQGATNRTPIVRPGSPLLPFEAPDRIAFDSPAEDVAFAQHDRPVADPETGNQTYGAIECDPDPRNPASPGAEYRPAPDFSSGAQPSELRGVFGFVALNSGQITVIDVEDLDAKCRRPRIASPGAAENYQGCAGDDPAIKEFVQTEGSPPNATETVTVTNEESCRVVEPHRARSAVLFRNDADTGIHAPSVRALPKLVSKSGRTLLTDRSPEGLDQPRMLGVNFSPNLPNDRARLYVGTTLYETGSRDNPLVIDPTTAAQNSLVLGFEEPRAYGAQEDFTATYEGNLFGERPVGRFEVTATGARLTDNGIVFCGQGIEDENVARERAMSDLGLTPVAADDFAVRHADYVVIKSDLLDRDDDYWQGARCGEATAPGASYAQCRAYLGTKETPGDWRAFRVKNAFADHLDLEPRTASGADADYVNEMVACCFPGTIAYEARASSEWVVRGAISGLRHRIATAPDGMCRRDCNPLRAHLESRAFEVACAGSAGADGTVTPVAECPKDENGNDAIGAVNAGAGACILGAGDFSDIDEPSLPVPGTPPTALQRCMFRGLTARFVIYRGKKPSVQDMQFSWQVRGGFSPWVIDLAANDPNTSPESMLFLQANESLVLTDGAAQGLVVVDLATLTPSAYY